MGVDEIRAVSLKCNSWTCEDCSHDRRKRLIAQAISGNPDTFITLTVNPDRLRSPVERARSLVEAWRQVVKEAKKQYKYTAIPYLCVFEATKRGEPHLHILARVPWIDQKWLSEQMAALIGAPVVDIRRISSASQVASYVAKYVGKAPHKFGTCKRYWQTRSYEESPWERPARPDRWSAQWRVDDHDVLFHAETYDLWGWLVYVEDEYVYAKKRPRNDNHEF